MATNKLIGTLLLRIAADTKSLRTGMAKTQSATAKLKKQVLGLGVAMVGAFASRAIINGLRSSINIMATFEQSMADVRSVTRATGDEFDRLSRLAQGLGRTTKFTASQVAQLEKEYAKLGFSTAEIENAAEATLNLAAAVGADLARAAEVAGGTIRGFQLDAKESTRVTDVMARSFTNTALDIEKYAESMKIIAPVANTVGVTLEETTALLGVLANNMIDGSMAGTSLRRIFLELAGTGGPLIDRLGELSEKGLTLADAEDEVGKRALTALLILTQQLDMLPQLTEAYNNAGGAAQEMAEVQLDTLKGELALLKSAYEGLIITMGESKDVMGVTKTSVGILSKTLTFLTDNLKEVGKANKAWFIIMFPGVRLFALFTKGVDSMRGSLEKLGDWFKDNFTLRQGIGETLGTSFEQFMAMERFGALGKGGPSFIGQPEPRGDKPITTTTITPSIPEVTRIIDPAGTTSQQLRSHETLMQGWLDSLNKIEAGADKLKEEIVPKLKEGMSELGLVFQQAIMGAVDLMGQFIEGLTSGDMDIAFKSILKSFGGFMVQMGKLLIAYGIGMEAFHAAFANPFAAIAAGIALVAIGSAISGLASRGPSTGLSASGAGGAGGISATQPVAVLRGADIHIAGQRGGVLIGGTTG